MPIKQVVLYLPVIHSGYDAFLRRHADAEEVLVLGRGFQKLFPALAKDIRALPPALAVEHARLIARRPHVRMIEPPDISSAIFADLIVMPDEEIMHSLAAVPDFPARSRLEFDHTFLRWDRQWSRAERPAHFDGYVSTSELDQEMMRAAQDQADHSSDWWRQVGAVASRRGKLIQMAYNHHLPSEYSPYIDGDPRNEFHRGVRADLSTAIHAEASLVAKCAREGVRLLGADLYVSTFPCPSCARLIAETGFSRCFFAGQYSVLDGEEVLRASGIELIWVALD